MTEHDLQILDKRQRLVETIIANRKHGDGDPVELAQRLWAWITESRNSAQEAILQELADLGQEIQPDPEFVIHKFGKPPTMRELVMGHLNKVQHAGATAREMADAFGVDRNSVGRRVLEYAQAGEIVRDSGYPARFWAMAHAPAAAFAPVPIQKQTALDGGQVSNIPNHGQLLSAEAIKVYNAIRRPGTDVRVTGPMDVPDVPLALAQRALSELSRLGYIAKENGVWTDQRG